MRGSRPCTPASAVRSTPSSPEEIHFLRKIRSLRILRSLRKAARTVEAMAVVCSGPYRLSHPPPPSSLNSLKSLSSLSSLSLSSLSPAQACIVLRGGVPPPTPEAHLRRHQVGLSFQCAGMARTQVRKHAKFSFCGAKRGLRLRGFVTSCETFRGRASRLPYKARMRMCTRTHIHACAYALARERVRAHARALPGSIRNPYGFEMKPV